MSKKRVSEITKELKQQGIELDNKEVVTELVALGYDVKTHSSTLEDDQASAALQRILSKRGQKTVVPVVPAKGFVVRRKAVETHAPAEGARTESSVAQAPNEIPAEASPEAPVMTPAEEAPEVPEVTEPVAEQQPEPLAAPEPAPEPVAAQPTPVPEPQLPEAPVAAQPVQPSMPNPPTPAPVTPTATPTPQAAQPAQPTAPAVRPGNRPGGRPEMRPAQVIAGRTAPGFKPAQVVSRPAPGMRPGQPQGRPGQIRPGQVQYRPGQPAQPGAAVHPSQPGQPAQPQAAAGGPPPAPVDPRTLRPTATQAVVISRPAVSVRRVTPTAGQGRQYPMAPGRKAIGEVREFKVVPDHLGRGRELVDVTRAKEQQQRGKKRTSGSEGGFNKSEVKDLIFGRVALPVRGKKRKPTKKGAKTQITEMAEEKKVIKLQESISVSDLSQRMGVKTGEIIKKLMQGGKMATANQMVDADTATLIASDYGWKVEKVGFEVEDFLPEVEARPEDERPRPPVVTVMGHVDHGKTSLLDAIRSANVASGEAGGITQHIGAYTVTTARGDVTFLDTPGHEAFTSMRARGADVTDLVVLVVAADDGVMPQTEEAIKHAKAAEVPLVVAINKIDLAGANPDRVKTELSKFELVPEEWGGDTLMVPVSAKTKQGLDSLLENIALQAEVLELTANPTVPAVGAIIEAKLEKGRGPVATVLVQEGTLKVGDAVVTGGHSGKVRMMVDSRGKQLKEVGPGYSAEVVGLSGVPTAGDTLNVVADERAAKEIAEHRIQKEREQVAGKTAKESLEALFAKAKAAEGKVLKLVIKADVQGSAEAVAQAVQKLSTPKVRVDIIAKGVGQITESDVMLASASKGLVVGFNTKPESGAEPAAKQQEVTIQTYSIIYELIDGVRAAMEDLLEPIRTERKLGRAEVRNLFNVPKLGTIAGSAVIEGTIKRTAFIRLLRDNKQVYSGKLASLKRFKDDVREVAQGFECGIGIENYSDLKAGDIIEAYEIEETRQSLS